MAKAKRAAKGRRTVRRCGLCGKSGRLTRTECCGQWICDDEHKYVLFSYERNSCRRNHSRYTLCGSHCAANHKGDWKTCRECRKDIETELYVHLGTNEYNFETLDDPPAFEPTPCSKCGKGISLVNDSHTFEAGGYRCEDCSDFSFAEL